MIAIVREKNNLHTFLSCIDVLTGVKAFNSYEIFWSVLVSVWVSEDNSGEGGATTWIMDDLLYYTLDVSIETKVEG